MPFTLLEEDTQPLRGQVGLESHSGCRLRDPLVDLLHHPKAS